MNMELKSAVTSGKDTMSSLFDLWSGGGSVPEIQLEEARTA